MLKWCVDLLKCNKNLCLSRQTRTCSLTVRRRTKVQIIAPQKRHKMLEGESGFTRNCDISTRTKWLLVMLWETMMICGRDNLSRWRKCVKMSFFIIIDNSLSSFGKPGNCPSRRPSIAKNVLRSSFRTYPWHSHSQRMP